MAFRELREFYDPSLHLPVGGKIYSIPAAQMDQALRLRHSVVNGMSEIQELAEIAELLGPVAEQMLTDGVRWTEYLHVGRTALIWCGTNSDLAEAHWLFGQLGERDRFNTIADLVKRYQSGKLTADEVPGDSAAAPAKKAPPKRAPRKRAKPTVAAKAKG